MTKRAKPVELFLELDFPNERTARSIYEALDVEIRSPSRKKADVSAVLKGKNIIIKIGSSTSSSMRAITNSYLRWIYSISETLSELKGS